MDETFSKRTGPPRRPTPLRRGAAMAIAAAVALGAGSVPPGWAFADSPGIRMRRARFALDRGDDALAAAELDAVRRARPGTARGIEAAMLLADLRFSEGDAGETEAILAEAEKTAGPVLATPISLARGWLAVSQAEPRRARARFEDVRAAASPLARAVAEVGLVWASLVAGDVGIDLTPMTAIARTEGPGAVRFAAGWTLSRAYAAAGDHRRALRELRRLRREVRGTSQEDDAELALGHAQHAAGRARSARRTFQRLERRFGRGSSRSSVHVGIRLSDLLGPADALARRVAWLYARRQPRSVGLIPFLAAILDRPAADDAALALDLAARRIAAGKEARP